MEREQIIKALECCSKTTCKDCPYTKNGKVDIFDITCSVNMAKDALALIKELTEENERLKCQKYMAYPDGKIEMIPSIESVKADTVNTMYSEIKKRCIEGGIYPAFVANIVTQVANELLEGKDENTR